MIGTNYPKGHPFNCEHDWDEWSPVTARKCRKCKITEIFTRWLEPGKESPSGPRWGIPSWEIYRRMR